MSTTASPTTTTKETATAFISTTLSTLETTIPEIIDADDYDFSVVKGKNEEKRRKVFPHKSNSTKNFRKTTVVEEEDLGDRGEAEEGSTPNGEMYTPGYDYVVEDRTTRDERIIDVNVFTTATSLKRVLQTTTPTLQTNPLTMHTTRALTTTTYPIPPTSTERWAKTTRYIPNPHTTPNRSPDSRWTHRDPLTTPAYRGRPVSPKSGIRAKQAPAATARKQFTTTGSPQPTGTVVKLKTSAVTPRESNGSRAKKTSSKPKGSRSRSQNPQPRSPKNSSDSDQNKLTARETVSMDIFWVVGNWSEVGRDILLPYCHITIITMK